MTQVGGALFHATAVADDRLLLFEIGEDLFALPIDGVLEVADMGEVSCIPTLPPNIAGVVNHHGDALTVVHRSKLLRIGEVAPTGTEQLLVISDRVTKTARFGLPVDRVNGLVPARADGAGSDESATEKRNINGRVTTVLDPKLLVERAQELIENSAGGIE